jgi:hypothetical protein
MSYIDIELDKPRRLRFDLAALRDLQRRLNNLTLLQIANRIREMDVDILMQSYYIALRWEDKALTPGQVDQMLQRRLDAGGSISELITPLSEAFMSGAGLITSDDAPKESPGKA